VDEEDGFRFLDVEDGAHTVQVYGRRICANTF
jgi:hypothetical protein